MRGLIWLRECSSDSSVTADGALERSTAFVAHVYVGENSLGNSAEQICWPSLWYENGVFKDCSFSLSLSDTSRDVPCSTLLNTAEVSFVWPSGQRPARFVLYLFQRKQRLLDWFSGRSGGNGSCAVHEGIRVWGTATVGSADLQWGVLLSKGIKLEKVSKSQSATWLLATEKHQSPKISRCSDTFFWRVGNKKTFLTVHII